MSEVADTDLIVEGCAEISPDRATSASAEMVNVA